MKKFIPLLAIALMFMGTSAFAQSVVGKWKTIDDKTEKAKSIVEIFEKDGKYYGEIRELFRAPDEDQDPVCEECKDHRKGQKVIGLEIVSDMSKDGDEYSGGEIMDPENGKTYRCKMWLDDENTLKVRGYVAFLYRTQTWHRVE